MQDHGNLIIIIHFFKLTHIIIKSCECFLNPSFLLDLSDGFNKNGGFRLTSEHQQHLIVIWAKVLLPAQLHPPIHLRHTNRKSAGFNAEQFTECLAFLPSRKYTKAWPLLNGALGITTGAFGVVGACSCNTEQMVRCSSDLYIATPIRGWCLITCNVNAWITKSHFQQIFNWPDRKCIQQYECFNSYFKETLKKKSFVIYRRSY